MSTHECDQVKAHRRVHTAEKQGHDTASLENRCTDNEDDLSTSSQRFSEIEYWHGSTDHWRLGAHACRFGDYYQLLIP